MRPITLLATLLLHPVVLPAQGEILPICGEIRCVPGRPCPPCGPGGSAVERVSSDVRAVLGSERVVRYEIKEVFTNRGRVVGEADYLLPLPRNAAFHELRLTVNGEPIAGEVMNAERARGIYEEIVRSQRDPALVEWMGQGLLRARIFPIAPGERKEVLVRYDAVVEREGDALRVDYFRGTRGGGSGPRWRIHPAGPADEQWRERLGFSLVYPSSLGRAWSPTHRVTLRDSGAVRIASVSGEAAHLTVLVPVRLPSAISLAAVTHAAGADRHVLLAITPPPPSGQRIARDVTLVIDVSGSMSGEKMRQARAAGVQVLGTLTPADRFRLIDFNTEVRAFREEFAAATSGNIAAGERYVRALQAQGGTNIEGALLEALRTRSEPGRLSLVLFITDGMATVGETRAEVLAELVARARGASRIFAFGIGSDVNVALLEQLALDGRGTAHFVRSEESIEHAVSVVASRLSEPVLTDVRVTVSDGVSIRDVYPQLPTDIFAGQDLIVLARYEGTGRVRVRVTGLAAGREVSMQSVTDFPPSDRRNDFVPRLWATRRIGHLVAERRQTRDTGEIDEEIRLLGLRYGLPSEFSSYLVLEPGVARGSVAGAGAVRAGAAGTARIGDALVTGRAAFESARAAAAQRDATTVADSERAGTYRVVAGRTFEMVDSTWTQVAPPGRGGMRLVRIKPYSRAYFDVMDLVPELRQVFALGERMRVHGRAITLELAATGTGQLTASAREALVREW
jgi:Ca-activated chloride channel homolog